METLTEKEYQKAIRQRMVFWRVPTEDGVKHMSEEDWIKGDEVSVATVCATCQAYWDERWSRGGIAPNHMGSKLCRSGSIASGGDREHCTCDACF